MRAVQYRRFGGPEVLETVEVDPPEVRDGTVRIRVRAAGVNPADGKAVAGRFAGGKELAAPAIPGFEAAGVVEAVGEGAWGVEVGDEVFGFGRGTWAEQALLDVWITRPRDLAVEEAAATPVAVDTALRMLDAAGVHEGDTVVIAGSAGGVGSAAIQLARARGAIVVGTASAANQGYVEALGALPVVYGDGWVDRVREAAVAEVDAALEVGGPGAVADLIALTGDPARVVSLVDPRADELGAHTTRSGAERDGALREAVRAYEDGDLRTIVERVRPLAEAAEALAEAGTGHGRGRSVLVID